MLGKLFRQLRYEFFDVICLMAICDEDGVFSLHDDEIADAQHSNLSLFRLSENDVVMAFYHFERAVGFIAAFRVIEVFGNGNPGANIIPVEASFDIEHVSA